MFSSRVPANLEPNRFARALAAARSSGRPLIDLTLSNPTRAGFVYPPDLLAPLADPRGLTYAPEPFGLPEARRAVAADYRRRGFEVAPERIVLTASTSDAYSLLFKLLCDPGDEVLVPRPSYPLFEHLTALDGVIAKPYDLEYHGVWSLDLAGIEAGLGARTRALLCVHPNNPTGSFVTPAERDQLVRLCAARDAAIIADEVFADYEIAVGAARARLPVDDAALVFSLGGLSKSAGLPQVKLGWIAVHGPEGRVRDALQRLEVVCDSYLSASTPVQLAAAELLARGAALRRQIQARVRRNYARLSALAAEPGAGSTVLDVQGGWSAVLRVPAVEREEALVVGLLEDVGVVTHPGYFFDFAHEAYLVLSLLPPAGAFDEGIGRILRHLACSASRT